MSTTKQPVSDMLITVKSREIQRGMYAEKAQQVEEASRHFLAAAHLELVLVEDYRHGGEPDLARRSQISAASCFWRAGRLDEARSILDQLKRQEPSRAGEIDAIALELEGASD